MSLFQRWWLCLSALVPFAADVGVTLAGQPASYWNGDYATAFEGNPLARLPLTYHPWAFVGAAVMAAAACIAFLLFGPNWLALVLAFAMVVGHSLAVCGWLFRLGWPGYLAAGLFLVLMERLLELSWQRAGIRQVIGCR